MEIVGEKATTRITDFNHGTEETGQEIDMTKVIIGDKIMDSGTTEDIVINNNMGHITDTNRGTRTDKEM